MSISLKAFVWPALGLLVVIAGCASGPAPTPTPGAIDTGTYPNLNIPPQSAAEQISPQDKAQILGSLGAARGAQAAAGATARPTANPVLLKKIAATHADDTLKEIADE